MQIDVLLGLQWGDEGKGKVVDCLTPNYNVIVRFQGGPNAGHSLQFNNVKHVIHNIPSGVFHKDTFNIIGNGVVLDPISFKTEIEEINKLGIETLSNLFISKKANLILPTHRLIDAASEQKKGKRRIGSTLKGIAPTYTDKVSRNALRVGDILSPNFHEKYQQLVNKHKEFLLNNFTITKDITKEENEWFKSIDFLRKFKFIDSEYEINKYIENKKNILAEGAQGTLLDIDFGSYPYVTSSNTIAAAACIGMGVAPKTIGEVFGIFKAYCTRVGMGPFPSELTGSTGETLQKEGHEFGATTGRPRRCGWLDLPALKYAIMLNGVTQLILTKADVLSCFDTVKIVTHYKINNQKTDFVPFEFDDKIETVEKEFKGWKLNITRTKKYDELPNELKYFINFIEQETKIPVKFISTGPDRDQMIVK